MPLTPNRPQFNAAAKMAEVPPLIERPLSYVRTSAVKALYWRHRALQLLSVGWLLLGLACLGGGLAAIIGKIPAIPPDDASLIGAGVLLAGLLAVVTSLGCFVRAGWGRVCAIILNLLLLFAYPYGCPFGALGLVALFRSSQLFGATRFDPVELNEEHRHRKKRYGA